MIIMSIILSLAMCIFCVVVALKTDNVLDKLVIGALSINWIIFALLNIAKILG